MLGTKLRKPVLAFACMLAVGLALVAGAAGAGGLNRAAAEAGSTAGQTKEQAGAAYDRLALSFVPNAGQLDRRVHYSAQAGGASFAFARQEVVLSFAKKKKGVALRLGFVGANRQARIAGQQRLGGKVNYLIGRDPAGWRTNLPNYGELVYRNLWPGIDLVFRGGQGVLKYELHVAPGASLDRVRFAYRGARGLSLERDGNLRIETALGTLRDSRPVSYQEVGGRRVPVASRFLLGPGRNAYGFAVGAYDRGRALVVDPGLLYSTFLGGGSSTEVGYGIAVDGAGSAYVAGYTYSTNFPTTAGAFDTGFNGTYDAFVTKLNAAGSALAYSTYLGSSYHERGRAIAVDGAGSAYVTGDTESASFPTTAGAFDTTYNGFVEAFVTKLNPAGSGLVYSTYLGGSSNHDYGYGIAVDGAGSAHITGQTSSADFPTTTGSFDTSLNGQSDAFLTKLDPAGSALGYSTYLGGSSSDWGDGIAVDGGGSAYVTGSTWSTGFPTTAGAVDTSLNGSNDAFMTKLNAAGSTLGYSTFLGGSSTEYATGIVLDGADSAYVSGTTGSTDFPTTAGAFDTSFNGVRDVFVTKLNAAGSAFDYSTYLGGSLHDFGDGGIAVDGAGGAYVTGRTSSTNYPVTAGAFDSTHNGSDDAFVTKLDATGSALLYSTYLGGSSHDAGSGIAIDGSGNAYITGETLSGDLTTTPGSFDPIHNGDFDAFATKLNAAGTAVDYSTYLGGSSDDAGQGVALDASGSAFVTGYTNSVNFPPTGGALDTTPNGGFDAFVTKLNAAGTARLYSTYLGGSADDYGHGLALDGSGSAYVTGYTGSTDFPTTAGAFDTSSSGVDDAFVTKLNAAGSAVLYSTYLGGTVGDYGYEIAVDAAGSAHVTGLTDSTDFPTTGGAFDTSHNGSNDAFVTKLNAAGAAVDYSTFLGGASSDYATGIALDGAGSAYVSGTTSSAGFPTTAGAFDTTHNGMADVFIARLDAAGAALGYSTYLGGSFGDRSAKVALDGAGSAYLTGWTVSSDFPTTAGAFDTTHNGFRDAFVTKLDAAGAALGYSTYLGGNIGDQGSGIAVDGARSAYVTGFTESTNFPTTAGAFDTSHNGGFDGFVTKLDAAGAALGYSTYLGGSGEDSGQGITVDGAGMSYVTGYTASADFPTTAGASDTSHNGGYDAFVTRVHTRVRPTKLSPPPPPPLLRLSR